MTTKRQKNPPTLDCGVRTDMGVKAAFMKMRTVQTCLNCERSYCNGCPANDKWEPRMEAMQ